MTEKGKSIKALKNGGQKSKAQPKPDAGSMVSSLPASKSLSGRAAKFQVVAPPQVRERAEKQFDKTMPSGAADAVREAYQKALGAGHPVLIIEGDKLIRVNADNSRTFVRNVEPPVEIPKGTTYKIK